MKVLLQKTATLAALISLIVISPPAATKPLWELAGGVGYISIPRYPGSIQSKDYFIPAPVFHYYGEKIQIDKGKISSQIFKNERIHIQISADGTPPVDSDEIDARIGMPDLDATIQIGPSFDFRINNPKSDNDWSFKLPLRLSIATDLSHFDDRGFLLNPKLKFERQINSSSGYKKFQFTMATVFASRRYLNYYYGVDAEFSTTSRSSYEPVSGYAGAYISAGISHKIGPWQWSAYSRVRWLNNTNFKSSPLVTTKQEKQIGLLLIYTFAQSSRQAPHTRL